MSTCGVPITNETLEQMSKYKHKHTITQEDRAREAMRMIHAESKNFKALQHVENLKYADYGLGVGTLCLLYNATGDTLKLVDRHDWHGSVYKEPLPGEFHNGQWLAFLHVHPSASFYGSEAAFVFRGHDSDCQVRDFMVAWCTRFGKGQNNAYTEVGKEGQFASSWDSVQSKLESSPKVVKDYNDNNCKSVVSIGGITSPEFIAIFKHRFDRLQDDV